MTSMQQRAAIGTRWRRRRDKTLWQVKQSHRKDRLAELVPDPAEPPIVPPPAAREFVRFAALRDRYDEVTR